MNFRGSRELGVALAALALMVNYSPWIQQRLLSLPAAQAASAQASRTAERVLIPGGQAVGVALHTSGVLVVKKDKRREPFDASKVRSGIIKACEKRPVPLGEIEKLVSRVEMSVCSQPEQEVTSEKIGLLVMDGLKTLDEVAYIRFASVYRQFKDVQSFMAELQQLLDTQKKPEE